MSIDAQATEFADAFSAMRIAMVDMNMAMDRLVRLLIHASQPDDALEFEVTADGAAAFDAHPWQVTHSGFVQFTGTQAECRAFAEAHFPAGGHGIGPVFSDDE